MLIEIFYITATEVLTSPKRSPKRPLASLENIKSPSGLRLTECNIRVEKLKLEDSSPPKIVKRDLNGRFQKCVAKSDAENTKIRHKDENENECSPPKSVKSDLKKLQVKENTPQKSGTPRKLMFDAPTTPSRVLSPAVASPARASPRLKRQPKNVLISPTQNENSNNTRKDKSVSPRRCRALTFTPNKDLKGSPYLYFF